MNLLIISAILENIHIFCYKRASFNLLKLLLFYSSQKELLCLNSPDRSINKGGSNNNKQSQIFCHFLLSLLLSEASLESTSSIVVGHCLSLSACITVIAIRPGPLIIAAGIYYLKACWEKTFGSRCTAHLPAYFTLSL